MNAANRYSLFRFLVIVLLYTFVSSDTVTAQSVGYVMPDKSSRIEIPFDFQNSFIVLDIRLQGFLPVKFIYDTGAETTILTNPRIAELLDFKYTRKFSILGSDLSNPLTAYLIKDVVLGLEIGEAPSQDILVFDRDHFNLEEFIGEGVEGILGNDVFRNYVVNIDYKNRRLVLSRKTRFKPPKKYYTIPMTVEKNKPYIMTDLSIFSNQRLNSKMLLDSGAALSIMIDADTTKGLNLPDKTIRGRIGLGIGGELEGYIGRVHSMKMGDFEFNNVVSNFRVFNDPIDTLVSGRVDRKDGLIGNEVLKHFNCVFDFPGKMLYLKPYYSNYNKRIEYDRSGLNLIMVGKHLQQIMINEVVENSPAFHAGLKKGDIIKAVNGVPTLLLSYSNLLRRFKKRSNKRFSLKVNRQGRILHFEFRLRDLI